MSSNRLNMFEFVTPLRNLTVRCHVCLSSKKSFSKTLPFLNRSFSVTRSDQHCCLIYVLFTTFSGTTGDILQTDFSGPELLTREESWDRSLELLLQESNFEPSEPGQFRELFILAANRLELFSSRKSHSPLFFKLKQNNIKWKWRLSFQIDHQYTFVYVQLSDTPAIVVLYIAAVPTKQCFSFQISTSNSGDARATLSWFLEMASGFYFQLLQKIRSKYDLDLPFLRSGESFAA